MSAPLPVLNQDTQTPGAHAPGSPKPGVLDVPPEELRAWFAGRGQPPMRVSQVRHQVLANRAESFDAMSDLPKTLRAELAESFDIFSTRPVVTGRPLSMWIQSSPSRLTSSGLSQLPSPAR